MLSIKPARLPNLIITDPPTEQAVNILADTEAEILALGETVTDGNVTVIPKSDSIAYTAGYGVLYHLSNSGVWTKVV